MIAMRIFEKPWPYIGKQCTLLYTSYQAGSYLRMGVYQAALPNKTPLFIISCPFRRYFTPSGDLSAKTRRIRQN
ncbi:MAG: hypothetical protein KC413_21270, partial [Anaerolineales bacterium]|nr:hypothetical protein [Anaerolineales bacterium]